VTARRFGNIRKLPSGRYQARWQAPDGKERMAPNTFAEAGEARAWLSAQETDLRRGAWVDPDKGRATLAGYAHEWLEGRADLRPRTVELYEGLLARQILLRLGSITLANLDVAAVRKWRAALIRAGVGAVTVAKAYRLLRTMLNTAVEDGRIASNPCIIKGAGVERSAERGVASVNQVYAIADAIEPRFRALVLLAALAGLRFGELGALTRERIDLEAGTVAVVESAIETDGGHRAIGAPKTDRGRRVVNIPPQIVEELREHLDTYVDPDGRSLVFVGPKGGPLRRANFHTVWAPAREAAGLPEIHFHDLRHTGNTLAAATGASTAELMHRMGHASPRAALIYQHATAERDKAIAAALGDMIGNRANRSRHVPGTEPPRLRVLKG